MKHLLLEEEARKRKQKEKYKNMDISTVKEQIISEIKQPASLLNYKNIIIDLCAGRELEFSDMLLKYSFVRNIVYEDELRRKLKALFVFYMILVVKAPMRTCLLNKNIFRIKRIA